MAVVMWIVEEQFNDRDRGPSRSWWGGSCWVGVPTGAFRYATREEAEAIVVGLTLLRDENIYARPVDEPR